MNNQVCDCEDCIDSELPCNLDCDVGYECAGCYEVKLIAQETMFIVNYVQGRR